jgi:hypothetical protein
MRRKAASGTRSITRFARSPATPPEAPQRCAARVLAVSRRLSTILYAAGRYESGRGARLLDRIPDPALRLFAQIEFAAGIAGLVQIGAITREQSRGHDSYC